MKNPKIYLIWIPCLALIGAGVLLWSEHSIVADLRTKLLAAGEVQTRHAQQMKQRIQELEQHAQAADARARELESQLAAAAAKSIVPPAPASAPATQTKPFLAVAGDASTIRAQTARMRLKMERQYGALAKQLGLNAAQTDQFMKLLVDKQLASADATVAAMQAGDNALNDPNAMAMLVAASRNDIEAQIQSLLGDSGYSQYLQAVRVTGQTSTLGRLQALLIGTEPLSDAQLGQLQQLLDANNINHISDKVMAGAQAQGFLTPVQMKALQNLFQEQQAGQARRRAP